MLRTLDRYILLEILPPFVLALLVFTFILEIPPIMEVAEKLITKGVPTPTILRIMLTLLPQALGVTIPMALLIGLLVGLGRLSGDRETVAMQACGVSLFRMLRPALFLGVLAWGATSYIMIVALPAANQSYREITFSIVAARAESEVKPRVFFEDFPNMVLYVRDVPPGATGWKDVFMADTSHVGQPDVFVASRGRMVLDRAKRRVELVLEDGTRHRIPADAPDTYEVFEFERMSLSLDPESVFPRNGPQRGDRELSIAELKDQADMLVQQGMSPHRPIMEMHKKFAIPFACMVFAVIGLALGVTSRKDGKLASFVTGIAVIFVYYVVMYMGESLAKGGLVSPHLAMWLSNLVLGVLGISLLFWRAWSAERRIAITLPFLRSGNAAEVPENTAPAAAVRPGSVPDRRDSRQRVKVVIRIPHISAPGWTILDGYVIKQYLRVCGLAFVGMLGIFYIATFIDLSDKLFKGQTTGAVLLQYFWYATPQFIYYVLPISALVSALVTIGLLTKSSELIVMKACGISLYRAALPLLIFGVVWSGVLFALEESILGQANRRAEQIRHVIRGGSPQTFDVLNRKWIVARNGNVYHYAYYDPRRGELNGLSVYEFADKDDKNWRLARRTFATQAAFSKSWNAEQGWVREFGARDAQTYKPFQAGVLPLEPPDYFITEQPDPERMTYQQLKRYIEDLHSSGFDVVEYVVALQRKVSFPFVTVIMTLIAVPFAVTTGSRGALYGIGVGLVLALVYWVAISVFGAIGNAGLIAPMLAAWAPNVLFTTGAAYLLLSVRT